MIKIQSYFVVVVVAVNSPVEETKSCECSERQCLKWNKDEDFRENLVALFLKKKKNYVLFDTLMCVCLCVFTLEML